MNKRSWSEKTADIILFLFSTSIILIVGTMLLVAPYCSGWNEGSMHGSCTIPMLEGLYNAASNFTLLFAFTGMLTAPIAIVAALVSLVAKAMRRKKVGPFHHSEIFYAIPLMLFLVLLVSFFGLIFYAFYTR